MEGRLKKIVYILAGLLILNIAVLLIILFPLRSRVSQQSGRIIYLEREVRKLAEEKQNLQNELENISHFAEQIMEFEGNYLGRRPERVEKIMEKIDELTYKFNLKRGRTTYSPVPFQHDRLEKMRIQFNVQGEYKALRYFINMLEKSSQFLILEGMALTDSSTKDLIQLNLVLTTYFIKEKS